MRRINRVTGIEGVAAGATPRVKFQTNRRYHGLKFFCTLDGVATLASDVVDRVRVYVNGTTIRDLATTRLLAIAALNGVAAATGELPIQFSEPWRADKVDEQMLAWDMFGESTFEVEFVMKASYGGGAIPGITGIAIFDFGQTLGPDGKVLKTIIRQVEISKNSAVGLNDFDNLPIRDPLLRIHLDAAQTINSVEVTADRNKVYEVLKAQNARVLADYGLVSTAFQFPICFDFTEQVIGDALEVQRELNVRFDLAVATQVVAVVESRANSFA